VSSSFSPPLTLRDPRFRLVSDGKPRRRLLVEPAPRPYKGRVLAVDTTEPRTSYVEGLWSPSPERLSQKSTLKHTHYFPAHFSAKRRAIFLSQAGPRFVLGLLQAEHHLWFLR